MFKYKNRCFIKLLLIILSEFVAMVATTLFSHYVFPIHHSLLSYLLCGAVLAAIVVTLYDKAVSRRKVKAERQLKELTSIVMKTYHIHDK